MPKDWVSLSDIGAMDEEQYAGYCAAYMEQAEEAGMSEEDTLEGLANRLLGPDPIRTSTVNVEWI